MINLDKTSSTKTRVLSDGELLQIVGGSGHHRSVRNHDGGDQRRKHTQHRNGNQHKSGQGTTIINNITFNITNIF